MKVGRNYYMYRNHVRVVTSINGLRTPRIENNVTSPLSSFAGVVGSHAIIPLCVTRPFRTYATAVMHFNFTYNNFAELNYCENNPELCQNGAKCVSLTKEDGLYRCMCREGTYGRNCEFSEYTTSRLPEITTTVKTTTTTATTTTLSVMSTRATAVSENTANEGERDGTVGNFTENETN